MSIVKLPMPDSVSGFYVDMRYRCGHVKRLAYWHEGNAETDQRAALNADCFDCNNSRLVAEMADRDKPGRSQ